MTKNLQDATEDNLKYMLDQLAIKLAVANRKLFDDEDYRLEQYDDLKFLFDHIMQTESLSPSETDAIVGELRNLRK